MTGDGGQDPTFRESGDKGEMAAWARPGTPVRGGGVPLHGLG